MITDVNVSLSRWPFRRLPHDELPRLVEKLRSGGVTEAWAGSFDGLFHKDIRAANARLVSACRQVGRDLVIPFGSINPTWPDWQEDLRVCHEVHHMPGIRLHPNYHGYTLDDPICGALFAAADQRGLIVQLALRMEDDRMQHPLMQVPDVDATPLPALLAACPQLQLVVLNGLRTLSGPRLRALSDAGQVYFEISMLEGVAGVTNLLATLPLERVLFGSHFPFFILESALLKLHESALTEDQIFAITRGNADRLRRT